MNEANEALLREYGVALGAFLQHRDEAALSQAYELGRRAMAAGLGVLDMAVVHREAVVVLILTVAGDDQPRVASAAAEFFQELLSPFEMTFRGYRGANEELLRLNETLRRQTEAAEAANRELDAFSYSVAHDLRAPLRAMDGLSHILLEDYGDKLDEEGHGHLRDVRAAAQHMARLIDGLLGLSRVTRTHLQRADVDLTALVGQIAARLRAGSPKRAVMFRIQEGVRGDADPALVAVLLENLVGNAWKFTSKRDDAEIVFGCDVKDGRVVYFVRDNGAGFDMAYVGQLFGAFQRLHGSADFEGTGIGLATVQRVVVRHEGRVRAEGTVGGGATFSFTLGGGATP